MAIKRGSGVCGEKMFVRVVRDLGVYGTWSVQLLTHQANYSYIFPASQSPLPHTHIYTYIYMSSIQSSQIDGSSGPSNGPTTSSSSQTTKELLTAALQSRVATNNYIAHLKIWETVTEGPGANATAPIRKARYLILAVQRDNGRVTVNKAKRNANGSFSIGKDWDLNSLREVTVEGPEQFTLTLLRSYSWETERAREQTLFLQTLIKVFRKYTGEDGPRCVGIEVASASTTAQQYQDPKPDSNEQDARNERHVPRINTAVHSQRSRESPTSARSRSSSKATADGFYDPNKRDTPTTKTPTIPTISTTPAEEDGIPLLSTDRAMLGRTQRRPTINRQASANAVLTPTVNDEVPKSTMTPPPMLPQSISQGNSPNSSTTALPTQTDQPVKLVRNPSRVAAKLQAVIDQQSSPVQSTESLTEAPVQASSQHRKASGDSLGSSLSAGGDARARLSSIESVRGGAAYEKMLLAGTGLSGVSEGDEHEEDDDMDPYGGAELEDADAPSDILPRSNSKPDRLKKDNRIDSKDVQDVVSMHPENATAEEDTALAHVEEMLEGFEFRSNLKASSRTYMAGKGTADVIEARLLDELAALEAANIHAIIESDDRVNLVVQQMEQALQQLDMIDSIIAGYKMQLNGRAEDISHIESQNRGLQVQTSNQRSLSLEIEKLLSTVNVEEGAVNAILYNDLQSDQDIAYLESASAALYKAMLQARRTQEDTRAGDPSGAGMAAATERLEEYSALADRFAKRLLDFLTQTFNEQTYGILHDSSRLRSLAPPNPVLMDHAPVEASLGRYCGLLLYAKEVSPSYFSRISAAYFASASERYRGEMNTLLGVWKNQVARVSDEEVAEATFAPQTSQSALRSGTIRRVGGRGQHSRSTKLAPGEVNGYESFARVLTAITPLVAREQVFISDLLHINNNNITFADYMDLEVYFRRRAAAMFGGNSSLQGPLKSMKDAMDLVFGFLAPEWQAFADQVSSRDPTQVVGMLAALDRGLIDAEESNCEFLVRNLSKLQMRLAQQLERFVADQIRAIEQTKLTAKKRKGVVHFIKAFPQFVERIESQLVNAETLQVRTAVDAHYEHICTTMFDALQTMAIPKMEGGTFGTSNTDEDKGLLNHHVILIENMFHFVKDVGRINTGHAALGPQLKRAQGMLEDAMSAYVQSVLRRPLGKMMDFGDGIDGLLHSTPANEVSLHSAYSRQAAKRLVKEYSAKDVRKAVEALSRRVQKHFDEEDLTNLITGTHDGGTAGSGSAGLSGGGRMHLHDISGISADEIVELLSLVWKYLEDGFTTECERMVRILKDCYSSNDARLLSDFTMEDVRRPFAANGPGGRRK